MANQPPPGMNQPPGIPPYQPVSNTQGYGVSDAGFFKSLFDFSFNSFVTPRIIKILYILMIVVAGLTALAALVTAFQISAVVGILSLIIGCPIYLFITIAFYRVVLEFFMVAFRMADDMRAIRNRGGAGM